MELIRREMPKDFRIADTSDYHVGSVNFAEKPFLRMIKRVESDPDLYLNIKGDLIEAITPKDKRYNLRSIDQRFKTPQDQCEYLIEALKPIKEKIIGMCIGNHEQKIINIFDAVDYICKNLGLKDFKDIYGAGIYKFTALHKNKVMFKCLFVHGKKQLPEGAKDPIQRDANRKAAQKRLLEKLGHADCVYSSHGHHHKLVIVHPTIENSLYLVDDGKKIKAKYRVMHSQNSEYIPSESRYFCGTASFRKHLCEPGSGAIDYAELYEPSEIGYPEIIVKDKEIVDVIPVTS